MQFPAPWLPLEARVAMAARCTDCDHIPKVPNAGSVTRGADGQAAQIMHNGLRIVPGSYHGSWMTDLIHRLRGHHEPQEEAVFHQVVAHLPEDATMVELGGYWAYYSLWFLKDQPGRRALVLEPDPSHLKAGKENAHLNGLKPEFLQGFAGASFAESVPFKTESAGKIALGRYPVERLLKRQGWNKLNMLHIDIQGGELEVLRSCEPLLRAKAIDWLFVSTHGRQITGSPLTHQRCLWLLRACGAAIEAEHDVHESFSGDGLIVARFCPPPPGWRPVKLSYNRHGTSLFRHLAYDLAEKARENAALRSQLATHGEAQTLHPGFRQRGSVVTLTSDGPLGCAGQALMLPDDPVIGRACRRDGSWELDNVRNFAAHMRPGTSYTLVDAGANAGLFTRQLAVLTGGISRAVCVEPDHYNFQALTFNLTGLSLRPELHNIALAGENGVGELHRDLHNSGNYSLNNDAMRGRSFDVAQVKVRSTSEWAMEALSGTDALLWKSDTQGYDEFIVSLIPMEIWRRVDVAMLELWRIAKPDYDKDAFRARLAHFPHRQLGEDVGVSVDEIMAYLDSGDWSFKDLLLWRGGDIVERSHDAGDQSRT